MVRIVFTLVAACLLLAACTTGATARMDYHEMFTRKVDGAYADALAWELGPELRANPRPFISALAAEPYEFVLKVADRVLYYESYHDDIAGYLTWLLDLRWRSAWAAREAFVIDSLCASAQRWLERQAERTVRRGLPMTVQRGSFDPVVVRHLLSLTFHPRPPEIPDERWHYGNPEAHEYFARLYRIDPELFMRALWRWPEAKIRLVAGVLVEQLVGLNLPCQRSCHGWSPPNRERGLILTIEDEIAAIRAENPLAPTPAVAVEPRQWVIWPVHAGERGVMKVTLSHYQPRAESTDYVVQLSLASGTVLSQPRLITIPAGRTQAHRLFLAAYPDAGPNFLRIRAFHPDGSLAGERACTCGEYVWPDGPQPDNDPMHHGGGGTWLR